MPCRVLFVHDQHWIAEPIIAASQILADAGWRIMAACSEPPDLVLAQQSRLDEALAYGVPVIILERLDGCQLSGQSRQHIANPLVRLIVKHSVYADRSLYNRYAGRAYVEPDRRPEHPIADSDLSKIRCGFSFASHPKFRDWQGPERWAAERSIPAFFAGTVEYGACGPISRHRAACAAAVWALPGCQSYAGRLLTPADYRAMLADSIAVVDPWGLGETCHRTFEAILSGCVLIRPRLEYEVEITEDIDYLECRPDWLDLEHRIGLACSIFAEKRERRIAMAQNVAALNTPAAIARLMAGFFTEALQG